MAVVSDGLDRVDRVLLEIPGIARMVRGEVIDYYEGALSFRAEDEHGQSWIATWLEPIPDPDTPHRYCGEVWLYARRPKEVVDDACAGRIPWREPWVSAMPGELYRVEARWPDKLTVAAGVMSPQFAAIYLAEPDYRRIPEG